MSRNVSAQLVNWFYSPRQPIYTLYGVYHFVLLLCRLIRKSKYCSEHRCSWKRMARRHCDSLAWCENLQLANCNNLSKRMTLFLADFENNDAKSFQLPRHNILLAKMAPSRSNLFASTGLLCWYECSAQQTKAFRISVRHAVSSLHSLFSNLPLASSDQLTMRQTKLQLVAAITGTRLPTETESLGHNAISLPT